MTVPVYIKHQPAGTLTVSHDGLYTVLEASAPPTDGLVRLWVHGGGKSAYFGVMEPKDGGLHLRRRLSRRELAGFPDPIESVSDLDQENLHKGVNINCDSGQQMTIAHETEPKPNSLHNIEPKTDKQPEGETDYLSCPWPAELPEEGLLWYRRPDGSLTAFDGISSLLAVPAELRAPNARMTERVIEGKKYLVFRY